MFRMTLMYNSKNLCRLKLLTRNRILVACWGINGYDTTIETTTSSSIRLINSYVNNNVDKRLVLFHCFVHMLIVCIFIQIHCSDFK